MNATTTAPNAMLASNWLVLNRSLTEMGFVSLLNRYGSRWLLPFSGPARTGLFVENCISLLYMGCGFYSHPGLIMAKGQNAKTLYLQAE